MSKDIFTKKRIVLDTTYYKSGSKKTADNLYYADCLLLFYVMIILSLGEITTIKFTVAQF